MKQFSAHCIAQFGSEKFYISIVVCQLQTLKQASIRSKLTPYMTFGRNAFTQVLKLMTIQARVKPCTNFDHIDQLKGQYRIK